MEAPRTLDEWAEYISGLSGKQLIAKARAANSIMFIRTLTEEGMDPEDIEDVLRLFAVRFLEVDIAPPTRFDGAYLNYNDLIPETEFPEEEE